MAHRKTHVLQRAAVAAQPAAGDTATLDEAVIRALGEEAMRAPTAGDTVRRLMESHRRLRPATVRQWLVPTVIATVVAVAFSVLDDGPRPGQVAARPLPSTFQSVLTWTGASTQQLGHLDMAHNGVHVRLDAGNGPGYWFGAWQRPCSQSLLAPSVGRIWTSIYFPQRDAQVSILAPNYAGIAWLTDRIEVD